MIICRMIMAKLVVLMGVFVPPTPLQWIKCILQYHTSGGFFSMMHKDTSLLSPLHYTLDPVLQYGGVAFCCIFFEYFSYFGVFWPID